MRYSRTFLPLAVLLLCLAGSTAFSQDAPAMEAATGPAGLVDLEQKGEVTVRALRGWGRLPDQFVALARDMRQHGGIDLLGADLTQVRQWIGQAEAGDAALAPFRDGLTELARFMDAGDHLDWTPVTDTTALAPGVPMRQGEKRWNFGDQSSAPPQVQEQPAQDAASAQTPEQPVQDAVAQDPATSTESATETPATPPVATASAPGEGLEFRISEQTGGTFRARLVLEGVQEVQAGDDPYFTHIESRRLPESQAVKNKETEAFNDMYGAWSSDDPYETRYALATVDTPVVIRIDAPDNPEIPLTEDEIRDSVRYEIAGRDLRFIQPDGTYWGSEIGYEEKWSGEEGGLVTWTPRLNQETGRPTGPRAIGVYMAYRVKKFIGNSEFGVLRLDFRRIGWVLIGMPGDVYSTGDSLLAVGQPEPLAGSGAKPNWSWPVPAAEKFDYELPAQVLQKRDMRLSEDMRHLAWVDGEPGQQRVVLNGVAGKPYTDVPGYSLRFSDQGESFCFEARLGDYEIPVCNGVDGPIFERIEGLTMTRDGRHVLVAGRVSQGVNRVYLDGVMIRETEFDLRKPVLAPDGTAAWVESRPGESGKVEQVRTSAGYEGPDYASIIETPRFTDQPVELYYIAEKSGDQRYLIRGGEELKSGLGTGYEFAVTPDSANYAYVTSCGENVECMVHNGKIGPEFSRIWNVAKFSADGSRHAYEAKRGEDSVLVVDGAEVAHDYGPLKGVWGITFSPDGQHWAAGFRLSDTEYALVVDGKEMARRTGKPRKIVFSPDGSRVAWLEDKDKSWAVILDGEAGPDVWRVFDEEPPSFSPDGRHLVYFYRDNDDKMHVAVFGGQDRVHELIPPRAMFVSGSVEYLAIDGNRFRRETIALD